jgi:Glycosyl hydrolase family 99
MRQGHEHTRGAARTVIVGLVAALVAAAGIALGTEPASAAPAITARGAVVCSMSGKVKSSPKLLSTTQTTVESFKASLMCSTGKTGNTQVTVTTGKLKGTVESGRLSCASTSLPRGHATIKWKATGGKVVPTTVTWSKGTLSATRPPYVTDRASGTVDYAAVDTAAVTGSYAGMNATLHIVTDALPTGCSDKGWKGSTFSGSIDPSYFMTRTRASAPQPTGPYRVAAYYPWYNGTRDWKSRYTPSSGIYFSTNPSIPSAHVDDMIYGKIQAGISSWWGPGSQEDRRFQLLLDSAQDKPFKWGIYYECDQLPFHAGLSGCTDTNNIPRLDSELTYIANRYTADPNYFRVDGKPVIFVYNFGSFESCAAADTWAAANRGRFFVMLKVVPGYTGCANQPDSWHEYLPSVDEVREPGYSIAISPGFYKYNEAERLSRDLDRWTTNVGDMTASAERFQIILTYNEWPEGTAVESAAGSLPTGWQSASKHGAFMDVLHNS